MRVLSWRSNFDRLLVRQIFRQRILRNATSTESSTLLSRFPSCATIRRMASSFIMKDARVVIASASKRQRLPETQKSDPQQEFPATSRSGRHDASYRILLMVWKRVVEPPTLHLLAAAACTTMGIGAVEGALLCKAWPFWESAEAGRFVLRYSIEQLFPSVVWQTQDSKLVAYSVGLDPNLILADLTQTDMRTANILLFTNLLATSRYFFAGFMMIAQLFRAANLTMEAVTDYEERVVKGREPPLHIENGLIVRLCGRYSHVSEVSLRKMQSHFFPVFENPDRLKSLLWRYSENRRRPVYWCVRAGQYGSTHAWHGFPAEQGCFIPKKSTLASKNNNGQPKNILVLEADATNGNDPLTLGEKAMDLTIEDASQGFRKILERFAAQGLVRDKDFVPLRVYLGNSMETATSGGGHSYTIRHRIQYAKEMDVLIDSRAAVLHKILEWCDSVAFEHRKIFFQTSSRMYFLNLQHLLAQYGYSIYDPLDLRELRKSAGEEAKDPSMCNTEDAAAKNVSSLLSVLLQDQQFMEEGWDDHKDFLEQCYVTPPKASDTTTTNANGQDKINSGEGKKSEMLRQVTQLAKLPRLVHMKTTAETVNAVDALIMAGEVDASSCCALIDREEGVSSLEQTLRQRKEFVQTAGKLWVIQRHKRKSTDEQEGEDDEEDDTPSNGLQIICSSSIHDDILRQVRLWAQMGYTSAEIQGEIDTQYQEILLHSINIQKQVSDEAKKDAQKQEKDADAKKDAISEGAAEDEADQEEPEMTPEEEEDLAEAQEEEEAEEADETSNDQDETKQEETSAESPEKRTQ